MLNVLVGWHPGLAETAVCILGLMVGMAVIIIIGIVRSDVNLKKRGYQVRHLAMAEYVYEEQSADAPIPLLPIWRRMLESVGLSRPQPIHTVRHLVFRGEGVLRSMTIYLPSEALWDAQVPPWARSRRAEIVERIIVCLNPWYPAVNVADSMKSHRGF